MLSAEPILSRNLPSGQVDDALAAHHREIERACLEIMSAGLTDDPRDLTLRWRVIERELLAHMATEEELLIPGFQQVDPENAQLLRDDHAALRKQALDLAIAIQLHTVRLDQLQTFIDALRAHAAREEQVLYPWAQAHLGLHVDHRLRVLAQARDG
jgi:iron-sulfur cluster repair protein YtfE (RIC family)